MPSLATFNANNFFLRYKFTNKYPGDMSRHSLIEATEAALVGYLPGLAFDQIPRSYIIWDGQRRELANRALREPDGQMPDILCLQEVENLHAVRYLDQKYFGGHYSYALLIDSKDARNIDVALMSRYPIRHVVSHIDDLDAHGSRVFSRDCLEAEIERRDLAQSVRTLIERLPTPYRTVLTLHYLQQVRYEEIAGIMAIPLGTVKTYIYRAKLRLRDMLLAEPDMAASLREAAGDALGTGGDGKEDGGVGGDIE